jgi:ABC-type nitrate/sulfonate/bicarbonate transport system substrate-binding protein
VIIGKGLHRTGWIAALALIAFALACGDSDDSDTSETEAPEPQAVEPASLTFMAGFKHQANMPFVGVYVAEEMGYFDEEMLDVQIRDVATPGDNFKFLAAGEVQITTADAQVLLERRAGDPPLDLVSIALIGQRGQQGFAVLKDSGIQTPKDWEGKRAGYKGSQVTPDYLAILAAEGLSRESVEEVKVGFAPQVLTEGQVDIFPVFLSNEPDTLRRMGFDVDVFEARRYGAPTLGLTYVTTGEMAESRPDVVQRFLNAALKGIRFASLNPDVAVDIVLKYAPQEDRGHQAYMLETEIGSAGGGHPDNGFGWQREEQWQRLHDFLVQYGALSAPLDDIGAVFTDQFLEEANEAALSLGDAAPPSP